LTESGPTWRWRSASERLGRRIRGQPNAHVDGGPDHGMTNQDAADPYSEADEAAVVHLLADLEREAARRDLPDTLRKLLRIGMEQTSAMLEAVRRGNKLGVEEIVLGTVREDGRRRPDGLRQVLPLWARGTDVLTTVLRYVDIDESQNPVAVTIHWERVPRRLRAATASLASELVDMDQPRPKGGRPEKSRNNKSTLKLGDPDTARPPA
jgi:hypothetical protein